MICLDGSVGPMLVVGGGPTGLRKIRTLLEARMRVTLISPEALPELALLADEGEIAWKKRFAERRDFEEHAFALLALPRTETERILPLAEGTGCRLNCCGAQELGTWSLAAQFRIARDILEAPPLPREAEDGRRRSIGDASPRPSPEESAPQKEEGAGSPAAQARDLRRTASHGQKDDVFFETAPRKDRPESTGERAGSRIDGTPVFIVGVASGGRSPGGSAALKNHLQAHLEGDIS